METRNSTTHNYKDGSVGSANLPKPVRLTPQKLEEGREEFLCNSFDNKYSRGHKWAENKLFYIDCEEQDEKQQET